MSILLNNKLLKAAEQKIEGQLTPENRKDYDKIVVSGMRVALEKGEGGILAALAKSKNPIEDSVKGAIGLCITLKRQSRGTMPDKAMVPAAMTLMLHALDFADRSGIVKVGAAELVQATRLFTDQIFQVFNITTQMLKNASAKINELTRDPAKLEAIKRAAGAVKAPGASEPTPMPGGNNGAA